MKLTDMSGIPLVEYRDLVERVMRDAVLGDTTTVFSNSGTDHAKIVLRTMLERAQDTVVISGQMMHGSVYEPDWIRDFLKRTGHPIRILVERDDVFRASDSALSMLTDVPESMLEVRLVDPQVLENHVAITDGMHVRLETSPSDRSAIVSFGDKKLAQQFLAAIDAAWADATPVSRRANPAF